MGVTGGRKYPSVMRWSPAAMAVATVLVVASCSGDDDTATTTEAPTTTEAVATTASPSTSKATTTTTTTTPPTTEAAGKTTVPDTAPATSSDVDEFATQAIEVIERTEASWDVVLAAFQDPFNDEKVAALDEYFTGNQLEGFNNLLQEYRDGNFRAEARPDLSDTYEAESRSLALDLEGGRATLQVCHIQTSLTVEVGAGPDGSDRVVADEIIEQIVELDLLRLDGRWMVSSARAPETEIASCD